MYGSWDMKCNRQKFFIILGHFLPFYPLKTPKMNYQKNEKTHGDIIILHKFNKNHDHRLYCSWDMARGGCNYFHFELYFFYPLTAQKMNISKNEKKTFQKTPGDMISLHKCIKNHDHMLYCSWDMEYVRCNCYFLFWAIFCPFTLLTARKMKTSEKWKKHLEISSFNTSIPKIMIICFPVPEIWCVTDVIVILHFRQFYALLPNSLKNENFKKMKKKAWRYLTQLHQKLW